MFFSSVSKGWVLDELRPLKEAIADLTTEVKALRLEADNVYQSTYRLHEKIRKRQGRKAAGEGDDLDINEKIRRGIAI
jgi:regulator of replication initiation timing